MISFSRVTLRRGPRALFENASFRVERGTRVGIVGANGSGKSSLFALLLGELSADQGDFSLDGSPLVSHVSQETPATDQSAVDYVIDGHAEFRRLESRLAAIDPAASPDEAGRLQSQMEQIDGYSVPARAAKLLHGLGFQPDTIDRPTASFSGGWRVRLNLARALMSPSDLLLLDEPTNHLDLDAVVWLEAWLRRYPGTLLLVSHDREFLDGICNGILHIHDGTIHSYRGNYSRFELVRSEQLAVQQAMHTRQQREIAHMESFVRRFRAKATKARQAQSRLKALERMRLIAPAHVRSGFRFRLFDAPRAADPLLKLDGVRAGYGDRPVFDDLSLSIGTGDRIGLVGPNGAGKSTLVKLLAGELATAAGERLPAQALAIGYFAQHQLEQLDATASPLVQLQRAYPALRPQELRDYLGGFGFTGDTVNDPIGPFSGGEKARLALAQLIMGRPNLLLLDEPTNHLDLEMRHALTVAMQEFDGALVLVSHDRHLINTVTDRLLLVDDGEVTPFTDDIEGYLKIARRKQDAAATGDQRDREQGVARAAGRGQSRKQSRQERARQRDRLKPLAQRIKKIESDMAREQDAIQRLDHTLGDPGTYETESTANLAAMMQEKSAREKALADLEAAWLEASEELEELQETLAAS